MEILLSQRSQMHALEEAWASASANRYCAVAAG
jgi:hypothetical protein